MAARLWTALLALAAVFAMHGAQCATAADHPADAFSLGANPLAPGHAHAMATAAMTPAGPIAAVPVAGHFESAPAPAAGASAPAPAGHAGAPHDVAAHLWAVCLAILAAALAVLLAWLVPRPVRLTGYALGGARARLRSVAPPRPPDLSALCLLRI